MMEVDDRKVVPEDLFFEILKEVPAKSLLRFRCVSKLWCSIIDDSNFVHSHRARSYSRLDATNLLLVFEDRVPCGVSLYSVDPEGQSVSTLIDRLTLHQIPPMAMDLYYVNGLISVDNYICNPSTRQTILLPPVTDDNIRIGNGGHKPTYSLGFDHSTKLYKVLAITDCFPNQPRVFNVLTLGTNTWRNVGGPVSILPQHEKVYLIETVYSNCANGVIFFFMGDFSDSKGLLRLHAFEVGDEKFRVMSLPQNFLSEYVLECHCFNLLLADDFPAIMIINNNMITIWILEDYAKQIWKMEHIQYPRQWQQNGRIQLPLEWWPCQEKIDTTPLGPIHKKKILFRSERERASNHDRRASFFYYDMQCKTSIAIPREVFLVLENRPCYGSKVTKHVETLFRLKK